MQQGDDEGPPAAPPPRFPFMKRGTGTQKYSVRPFYYYFLSFISGSNLP